MLEWGEPLDILPAVIHARRYADGGPTAAPNTFDASEAAPAPVRCDSCGDEIDGAPAGSGLFLWTRGEEIRYEEPPLCERCAYAIAVGGLMQWEEEEG